MRLRFGLAGALWERVSDLEMEFPNIFRLFKVKKAALAGLMQSLLVFPLYVHVHHPNPSCPPRAKYNIVPSTTAVTQRQCCLAQGREQDHTMLPCYHVTPIRATVAGSSRNRSESHPVGRGTLGEGRGRHAAARLRPHPTEWPWGPCVGREGREADTEIREERRGDEKEG